MITKVMQINELMGILTARHEGNRQNGMEENENERNNVEEHGRL